MKISSLTFPYVKIGIPDIVVGFNFVECLLSQTFKFNAILLFMILMEPVGEPSGQLLQFLIEYLEVKHVF